MSDEYIIQRRIKHQKLRRKARRGEIMLRRTYKFVRFVFIIFIFYFVYRISICHYWYLSSNIYNEPLGKHIEILGNDIVSENKILKTLKSFPVEKKPLYMIDPAPISNKIEELTPIKRAYVRRYWLPARYLIMVEEVTPAIEIAPSEDAPSVAALAFTGELITREYLPLKSSFNTAKILSYGTKGDDYENWNIEKINNLYKLFVLLEEYSGEKVMFIDLRIPHNAFAQLESVKIRLGEIDPSVFERIKAIHDILPAISDLKLKTQYIDLSWKNTQYIKEIEN